ncbi:MAG: hypothetical protein ACYCYM_05580 [Saccharofermentanales bacterium]
MLIGGIKELSSSNPLNFVVGFLMTLPLYESYTCYFIFYHKTNKPGSSVVTQITLSDLTPAHGSSSGKIAVSNESRLKKFEPMAKSRLKKFAIDI